MVSRGIVFIALNTPPATTASAKAAMLTVLGISTMATTSYSPKTT
jgi:hypothetical protein